MTRGTRPASCVGGWGRHRGSRPRPLPEQRGAARIARETRVKSRPGAGSPPAVTHAESPVRSCPRPAAWGLDFTSPGSSPACLGDSTAKDAEADGRQGGGTAPLATLRGPGTGPHQARRAPGGAGKPTGAASLGPRRVGKEQRWLLAAVASLQHRPASALPVRGGGAEGRKRLAFRVGLRSLPCRVYAPVTTKEEIRSSCTGNWPKHAFCDRQFGPEGDASLVQLPGVTVRVGPHVA